MEIDTFSKHSQNHGQLYQCSANQTIRLDSIRVIPTYQWNDSTKTMKDSFPRIGL